MAKFQDTDWHELCRKASQEQDPHKLLELLRDLNDALAAQWNRAAPGNSYTNRWS